MIAQLPVDIVISMHCEKNTQNVEIQKGKYEKLLVLDEIILIDIEFDCIYEILSNVLEPIRM